MRCASITAKSRKYSHILLTALLCCPGLYGEPVSEYRVKAAYLFNFIKLVEPSSGLLPAGSSPILFCVLGEEDDFADVLRSTVSGKTIAGHAISVRTTRSLKELSPCQLVFVRSSETGRTAAVISSLAGSGTLLIGEDDSFLANGGMINLSLADGKVHFDVNSSALARGHIALDPSLLIAMSGKSDRSVVAELADGRAVTSNPSPEMPDVARRMNLFGTVQLQAVIRPDGTVKDVRVLGGNPVLVQASVVAVRQWRYRTGPSETVENIRFSFGK